jgi:trehalose 2-sulfotransferase
MRNYLICTTARSGSNLLCDYLRNSGILGRPGEIFNPDVIRNGHLGRRFEHSGSISAERYIVWVQEQFRGKNEIFGAKLLYEDLEAFGGFPAFRQLFEQSALFWLIRRDKLGQAISYYIAQMTGQWVSTDSPKMSIEDLEFDYEKIQRHIERLVRQDMNWQLMFERLNRKYVTIIFEEFIANPAAILREIADKIGQKSVALRVHSDFQEQKNEKSVEFRNDILREIADRLFRDQESNSYKGLEILP